MHAVDLVHQLDERESAYFDVGKDGVLRGFAEDFTVKHAVRLNDAQLSQLAAIAPPNSRRGIDLIMSPSDVSDHELFHPAHDVVVDIKSTFEKQDNTSNDKKQLFSRAPCYTRGCKSGPSCKAIGCRICLFGFCS